MRLTYRVVLPALVAGLIAAVAVGSASAGRPIRPVATAAVDNPGGSGYAANAAGFRGRNGERFVYTCPKYGVAGSIWGTDIYTDDSSVCSAGVHTGAISLAGGGTVTIEIRPGEAAYTGSARNRVTSSSYPTWTGSFVVVAATPDNPGVGTGGTAWSANAAQFRNFVGAQFEYDCPAKGAPGGVWGTNVYTDDSSVCTAAVHGGLITLAKGGKVKIEMRDGQPSYRGSTRNGIKSRPYPAWGGSFIVVDAPDGPETPEGTATGNVTVNGQPFVSGPIRYGSTVDVTGGTLSLTAAGVGNLLTFGDGSDPARFKLNKIVDKVGKTRRLTAELALSGGDFGTCVSGARASAGPAGKVVRSLWSSGKGNFRTKGRYASATIRGTKWQTTDQCDGTLTTVEVGSVNVKDVSKKKVVVVQAGGSYLAKAP
jgi:hypothetical protein